MTMKSVLLGAAAGIATVSVAQAADLPMTKAEAVEYVKVCSEFGPGFFYIPGTDTCLKISGNARADYTYGTANKPDRILVNGEPRRVMSIRPRSSPVRKFSSMPAPRLITVCCAPS